MSRAIGRSTCLVLLQLLGLLSAGCGATVYSPSNPVDPTAVYFADYGRHSSIFLPVGPAAYAEYSFGDWNFYALGKTSNCDGLAALFWSQSSALGRRYARSTAGEAEPAHLFQPRIFQVCVARSRMRFVRDRLENRWHAHLETKVYNQTDDTEFVRDSTHYSWLYDCNDWTAQVLRDMGCKVVGVTTLSAFHPGDRKPMPATREITTRALAG
ncbi:MAG TPA: DUF2459 domain-containing protein [Tepidisphaeraceae bacterium]|jgi:hypothetical protein|nr:DUF2459 domain-containing protein [Tepidisphaeraceae bacterium]